MGTDLRIDLKGKGEGGAAFFGGDLGCGSGADGVEERGDFEAKGFAWGGGDFSQGKAGGGVLFGGLFFPTHPAARYGWGTRDLGSRGLFFPTHPAVRLRYGWGTRALGGRSVFDPTHPALRYGWGTQDWVAG